MGWALFLPGPPPLARRGEVKAGRYSQPAAFPALFLKAELAPVVSCQLRALMTYTPPPLKGYTDRVRRSRVTQQIGSLLVCRLLDMDSGLCFLGHAFLALGQLRTSNRFIFSVICACL